MMWTCALWIALSAVLTGGALADYTNVTLEPGANYTFSVLTFMQQPETCHLDGPHMNTINFIPGEEGQLSERIIQLKGNDMSACTVTLTDVTSADAGFWTIYYSGRAEERTQVYKVVIDEAVSEVTPESLPEETTAEIIPETTTESIEDEDDKAAEGAENVIREIEMLDEQRKYTKIGSSETVTVARVDFVNGEGCSLKTPDGIEHPFSNLNVAGVEIVEGHNVECGVTIQVTPENIGEWMLLVQAKRFDTHIEKRLPFTIVVEEFVYPLQEKITITEGNDLYLSLKYLINSNYFGTCKITPPSSTQSSFDIHQVNNKYCEFLVRSVDKEAAGTWRISYGNTVTYYTHIDIYVTERSTVSQENLDWINNRPVNVTVGPENAIYCRVQDPSGFVVFDGFGRCQINLERATSEHSGYWKMTVGFEGRVVTDEHNFYVSVKNAVPKALVTTSVKTDKPAVMISCSVNTTFNVHACKFRNPQGKILIASPGIGEDDYIFHDESVSYESNVHSHDCGIRMNNPSTSDLGLWRCAIETQEEVYYGFLPVLCPWSLSIPEIAATVVQVPTLTAVVPATTREEGESVTLSCSVQSAIRYCYFRASNGTTFSVSPDSNSDAYEYVGAGFDAGECGIRFNSLLARDSGRWSCHVGFPDSSDAEQRVNIQVTVHEVMDAYLKWDNQNNLLVEARVNGGPALEYCRFVRIDGFGFTTENMPAQYYTNYALQYGVCGIVITEPTMLDRHPWTVAAKVRGRDVELSQSTDHAFHNMLPIEEPGRSIPLGCLWFMIIFISLVVLGVGVIFGPKKNRERTLASVSRLRNSVRNSIKKQPLTEKPLPTYQA